MLPHLYQDLSLLQTLFKLLVTFISPQLFSLFVFVTAPTCRVKVFSGVQLSAECQLDAECFDCLQFNQFLNKGTCSVVSSGSFFHLLFHIRLFFLTFFCRLMLCIQTYQQPSPLVCRGDLLMVQTCFPVYVGVTLVCVHARRWLS